MFGIKTRLAAWRDKRDAKKEQEWIELQNSNQVAIVIVEKIRNGDPLNIREIYYGYAYDVITIQEIPCDSGDDFWIEYRLNINDDQINASEHILKDIYLLCKEIFKTNKKARIATALDAIQ